MAQKTWSVVHVRCNDGSEYFEEKISDTPRRTLRSLMLSVTEAMERDGRHGTVLNCDSYPISEAPIRAPWESRA